MADKGPRGPSERETLVASSEADIHLVGIGKRYGDVVAVDSIDL